MRNPLTLGLFVGVMTLSVVCLLIVWPSTPGRYLPGDFWPEGRGLSIGGFERATMRLGLDLQGGAHLVLQAEPPPGFDGDINESLEVAKDVIARRVDAFGVVEPEIQIASGNRLDVQVPGMTLSEAETLIGRTASLQYRVLDDQGGLIPAVGVIQGVKVAMTGQHLKNNHLPRSARDAVRGELRDDGHRQRASASDHEPGAAVRHQRFTAADLHLPRRGADLERRRPE